MRKLLVLTALLLPATQLDIPKVSPYKWYDRAELRCLADNIYHESRGQKFEGQMAVARVTLNRAKKLGESICRAVYKPNQFSWTKYANVLKISEPEAYKSALHAAHAAQHYTLNATYYHTTSIKPYWAKNMKRVAVIGDHVFY